MTNRKCIWLLLVLMAYVLSGCTVISYEDDLDALYKDYWVYSLGDYQVSYKVVDDGGSNGSGGFRTNKWREYTFTFADSKNRMREITVSNYRFDDMNRVLLNVAEAYLEQEVRLLLGGPDVQAMESVVTLYDLSRCSVQLKEEKSNLSSSSHGLKFRELSLDTLAENLMELEINTSIHLENGSVDVSELRDKLIKDVSVLFEHDAYASITICFHVIETDTGTDTNYLLRCNENGYYWG